MKRILLALGVAVIVATALISVNVAMAKQGNKVLVCHIPSGDPGNAHEILVGPAAVQAHLEHGDALGTCDEFLACYLDENCGVRVTRLGNVLCFCSAPAPDPEPVEEPL